MLKIVVPKEVYVKVTIIKHLITIKINAIKRTLYSKLYFDILKNEKPSRYTKKRKQPVLKATFAF